MVLHNSDTVNSYSHDRDVAGHPRAYVERRVPLSDHPVTSATRTHSPLKDFEVFQTSSASRPLLDYARLAAIRSCARRSTVSARRSQPPVPRAESESDGMVQVG